MSGSSLRPKPPPSRWLLTITFSTGRPAAFAASDCTRAHDLRAGPDLAGIRLRTCTVQFSGSIVACARNGSSYAASSFSPVASPLAMSPSDLATAPSFSLAARRCAQMSVGAELGVRPFVPVDLERVETLLRRPHVIADDGDEVVEHDDLAHARDLLRRASSTLPTLPPNTGQAATRRELHVRAASRRCRRPPCR